MSVQASPSSEALARFRAEYGAHRAAEGRGAGGVAELLALPYLTTGPTAGQWAVRARTFDAFVARVVQPLAREVGRALRVLDLGAGNGWLCYRMAGLGHDATAVDVRDDAVDGLGAAAGYALHLPRPLARLAASFDALPVRSGAYDLAVFNASLHYALDLSAALGEAARAVRPGGRIAILDSPFYRRAEDGEAMVEEKRRTAEKRFGGRAGALTALPFVEYLTRERLAEASAPLGLAWRRHRVRYPLRYEARPLIAFLERRRTPSRFDLWECTVP
ncbi:MAG TPA: class I SAM-dependent methyltransferase [Longimicrobium sp.]|nr:class I SAM-dependent methyltransferase [Longimicrobium sp.]